MDNAPETKSGQTELNELPDELRVKLHKMGRTGLWEIGLGITLGILLITALVALIRRESVALHTDIPLGLVLLSTGLIVLLAWFAQDRAKRANIYQFETIAEVLHRHFRTEQALRDPLTGCYNRAALEELSERFLSRAERSNEKMSLAVLDLDYFHELNSTYGHIAGDLALSEFAHMLHSATRGSDVVARYGGDEFVLLLPETPMVGADIVVKRVVERMNNRNERLAEGQIPLAFTAGIAEYKKGEKFSELFREADFDLLRRKAARPTDGHTVEARR